MTLAKICGIRTLEQARAALDSGADFLGFIFYRPSDRYVDPAMAGEIVAACRASFGGPERWQAVGVFVDEPLQQANEVLESAELDLAQVCGGEDRDYCQALRRPAVRVLHVGPDGELPEQRTASAYGATRLLLDTHVRGHYGGTGRAYAWEAVSEVARECFLAGGLTPANVADAIAKANPWAVDVSTGVEREGVKDPELIRGFIREVRSVDRAKAGGQP